MVATVATVKGRCVTQSRVGIPFLGVSLNGLVTQTDNHGFFSIQVWPRPEPYLLMIRGAAYKPINQRIQIPNEGEFDLGTMEMIWMAY